MNKEPMKKLVYMFLLVGSLLIGANVVNATSHGNKKSKAKMVVSCSEQTAQIKALIGTPDLALTESALVKIAFSISENNIISVTDVKTDNAELKKFVFQKLNGKRIDGNNIEMKDQLLNIAFQNQEEKFNVY